MRIKSARPRVAAPVTTDGELDPLELLHSEQLPVPTRTKQLQSMEPVIGESEDQRLNDSPELENDSTSVVTVPKFQYSVPIPVKIHGSRYQFRYQSKTQKYAN